MTTQQYEAIAEIMDTFDFDKVRKIMDALEWEWRDEGVPDNYTIRSTARQMLVDAIEKKTKIDTGGFVAHYYPADDDGPEIIELSFVLESYDTEIEPLKQSK